MVESLRGTDCECAVLSEALDVGVELSSPKRGGGPLSMMSWEHKFCARGGGG